MPYSEKLNTAKSISRIQISGFIHADAEFIEINLLFNAPEWHEYIGATPLQIRVDFKTNSIKMQTYNYEEKWYGEKILKDGEGDFKNPFKKGEMFDLVIEIAREQTRPKEARRPGRSITVYKMKVNGIEMNYTGDLPVFTINWLRFDGNFDLSALPTIEYKETPLIVAKRELEHLFFEGEELCLSADIKGDENNSVEIYLFHDVNEIDGKVGDTLLRIQFAFNKAGVADNEFYMWKYYHHLDENQQALHQTGGNNPLLKQKKQPYQLLVRITTGSRGDQYGVEVNDGKMEMFSYMLMPDNTAAPPAYGVNWLTVTGKFVENLKIGNESEKCLNAKSEGQKPLPWNIKQVDPNRPLTMKDLITINGTIKKKTPGGDIQITVGLFHGNVEWHPFIGETVLQVNITANYYQIGTYYNMKWKFKDTVVNLKKPLREGDQFRMTVRPFLNDEKKYLYYVHIGSETYRSIEQFIPLWGIQYIAVKGDLEGAADNQPPLIEIGENVGNS